MKISRIVQLDFLPRSVDLALLVLRVWLGLALLWLHGRLKLTGFSGMSDKFPDPLGLGPAVSLSMAMFAEVLCAALLVLGLFTRAAALVLIVLMSVAFLIVHKGSLEMGPNSGELAFIYLAGFVALFIAGPGRFALDARISGSKKAPPK